MGRLLLGGLLGVLLALTGYFAYSTYAFDDSATGEPAAAAVSSSGCCSQEAATCPSETAAATDETPACCKVKANCCQTKGEEGACCKDAKKPEQKD